MYVRYTFNSIRRGKVVCNISHTEKNKWATNLQHTAPQYLALLGGVYNSGTDQVQVFHDINTTANKLISTYDFISLINHQNSTEVPHIKRQKKISHKNPWHNQQNPRYHRRPTTLNLQSF